MSILQTPHFICKDDNPKTHDLTCDGGKYGQYRLIFCDKCYETEDKRFVISEMIL
jgi:hypothetical protein